MGSRVGSQIYQVRTLNWSSWVLQKKLSEKFYEKIERLRTGQRICLCGIMCGQSVYMI